MDKKLKMLTLAILILGLVVLMYFRFSEDKRTIEDTPVLETIATVSPSPTPKPQQTPQESTKPAFEDKPELDIGSWELTLANADNPQGPDFVPELADIENGQSFDTRAAEALKQFIAGARSAGLTVCLSSAYRSYTTQEYLFNNKVNQYVWSEGSQESAIEKAKTIVAYPGTSEHQLGLAADIVDKYYEFKDETLAETELSKWMAEHCAEYGFILRYPKDKTDITKVMFEPWHFRYVGVEAATYMMQNGLCLEEFIALYKA